ncbi:hypothetical protein NFI96_026710 [Prochilodus magdalenae]|nr:hypothetical protein NFI96_026710 [Prochilodus magdalenae]
MFYTPPTLSLYHRTYTYSLELYTPPTLSLYHRTYTYSLELYTPPTLSLYHRTYTYSLELYTPPTLSLYHRPYTYSLELYTPPTLSLYHRTYTYSLELYTPPTLSLYHRTYTYSLELYTPPTLSLYHSTYTYSLELYTPPTLSLYHRTYTYSLELYTPPTLSLYHRPGSKTAGIKKQQKDLMNSLSSSTEHAQKSTVLFRNSNRTVHNIPVTPEKSPQLLERNSDHTDLHKEGLSESVSDGLGPALLTSRTATLRESLGGFTEHLDAGSPYCGSEAEDSLLDGGETSLDKSSSMGLVDSSNMASSEDVRTLACVLRSEVILIDEDDDDMSLRERTVTDCSVTDGNAAQLVCGRLLSVSSDSSPSVCERQSQSLEVPPLPEQEEEPPTRPERVCCHCTIL